MKLFKGELLNGTELLLTIWESGEVTLATRAKSWHTWSPPVTLHAEQVSA